MAQGCACGTDTVAVAQPVGRRGTPVTALFNSFQLNRIDGLSEARSIARDGRAAGINREHVNGSALRDDFVTGISGFDANRVNAEAQAARITRTCISIGFEEAGRHAEQSATEAERLVRLETIDFETNRIGADDFRAPATMEIPIGTRGAILGVGCVATVAHGLVSRVGNRFRESDVQIFIAFHVGFAALHIRRSAPCDSGHRNRRRTVPCDNRAETVGDVDVVHVTACAIGIGTASRIRTTPIDTSRFIGVVITRICGPCHIVCRSFRTGNHVLIVLTVGVTIAAVGGHITRRGVGNHDVARTIGASANSGLVNMQTQRRIAFIVAITGFDQVLGNDLNTTRCQANPILGEIRITAPIVLEIIDIIISRAITKRRVLREVAPIHAFSIRRIEALVAIVNIIRVIVLNPNAEVGGGGTTGIQLGGAITIVIVWVVVVQIDSVDTAISIQVTIIDTVVNQPIAGRIHTGLAFAIWRVEIVVRIVGTSLRNEDLIVRLFNIGIRILNVREHRRQERGLAGRVGGPERNRDGGILQCILVFVNDVLQCQLDRLRRSAVSRFIIGRIKFLAVVTGRTTIVVEIQVDIIRAKGVVDAIVMEPQRFRGTIAVINDGGEIARVQEIRGIRGAAKNGRNLQYR